MFKTKDGVSWFEHSELFFHLLKLDSKQNLNVLHKILAKRSSFSCRVTVTHDWEWLGVAFRSCVNPTGVPDNLTTAVTPLKKLRKVPLQAQITTVL